MTTEHGRKSLTVGVTGGIGTGKTTVCHLFEERGRTVIWADELARDITENDRNVQQRLREAFGNTVFDASGKLRRTTLASIVFEDNRLKDQLDSIVHPQVFASIDRTLAELPTEKLSPYVLIEAALVFESGMHKWLDYIIVVNASERSRIARVMQRNSLTEKEVRRRIRSQLDQRSKTEKADFVLENDGSVESLAERVAFLDALLTALVL